MSNTPKDSAKLNSKFSVTKCYTKLHQKKNPCVHRNYMCNKIDISNSKVKISLK